MSAAPGLPYGVYMSKRLKTTHIVIHRAEVWTGKEYHFVVLRDGKVEYCVPVEDKGAHAFRANAYSVGIALQGCFASALGGKYRVPTDVQYRATKELIGWLKGLYGELKVVRHSDLGMDGTRLKEKLVWEHSCPGDLFDMNRLI